MLLNHSAELLSSQKPVDFWPSAISVVVPWLSSWPRMKIGVQNLLECYLLEQAVKKYDEYISKWERNYYMNVQLLTLYTSLQTSQSNNWIHGFTNCEFRDLQSEMIHDRFVIGICDGQLSEHLKMESDLTLQSREVSLAKSSSDTTATSTEAPVKTRHSWKSLI